MELTAFSFSKTNFLNTIKIFLKSTLKGTLKSSLNFVEYLKNLKMYFKNSTTLKYSKIFSKNIQKYTLKTLLQ